MKNHFQVLVIGGGNAGLSVASLLLLKKPHLKIGILEPSEKHYYQPAWTLVGGGVYDILDTVRPEKNYIPEKAVWIKDFADTFDPLKNKVITKTGFTYTYDFLVVCPGIQLNWDAIKGLRENLGRNGVTSNYSFITAPYTFECIKNYKGGPAIFHSPDTPVKCGGAPHKIMYLAADYFRKHGMAENTNIQYWSGGTKLFAIERYEKTLLNVVKRGNIKLHFGVRLEEIDGVNKKARFAGIGKENSGAEYWVDYEFIHVTPPQSPPDFIRNSPLAGTPESGGWIEVDPFTLQHKKCKNVFALGDAAGLPTSKTGAAIRKQTPVVVNNLLSCMKNQPMKVSYNGYSSCPIVTGYGKLMLAEFGYDNEIMETFPFDQSKERWSMYQLKRQILPRMYWGAILKGRMQG
jgi:sulfide:quinone oxidoreductase